MQPYLPGMIGFLGSFCKVEGITAEIEKRCVRMYVPANTILLDAGEPCPNMYFVEKGLARTYFTDSEGKEITTRLVCENSFITATGSYSMVSMSSEVIEVLEPSIINMMSREDIDSLSAIPYASICLYRLFSHLFSQRDQRYMLFRQSSVEDKFRRLATLNPGIIARTPAKILASYLEITPETLSRIMAKEEFANMNFDEMQAKINKSYWQKY